MPMGNAVNRPRPVILVQCLSCQHRGFVSERELVRFGIKPGAPVVQFVKRLRCRKCGSGSVMAQRTTTKSVA
jgi:DNA-directed RNA polymerase subunit RPC12/RpoP